MIRLALVRHGTTEWNARHWVQGSTDIPLSEDGIAQVKAWRLPAEFKTYRWMASNLSRARQTAELLSGKPPETDPRLAEMCWGDWEGRTVADLRAELGDLMAAWEAEGLDFRGPKGESPRDVQVRMASLQKELADAGDDTIAATHKGVIRAVYAAAVGWDMVDKPPVKMLDDCVQVFFLDEDGKPSVDRLNISLEEA